MRRLLAGGLLVIAVAAQGDDRLWILTGEGYTDDYYFGGGLIIPFPRSHLGQGWVQRYWLDAFTYSYQADTQQIDSSVWVRKPCSGIKHLVPAVQVRCTWGCATPMRT